MITSKYNSDLKEFILFFIELNIKIYNFIKLGRPQDSLASILAFFIGLKIAGSVYFDIEMLLATISFILGFMGITAYNDIKDIKIDKMSNPKRPLVTKKIKPHEARIFVWITLILSATILSLINLKIVPLYLSSILLGILYSNTKTRFSHKVFLSLITLTLATLVIPFFIGRFFISINLSWKEIIILPAIGLLISRIILKDIKDIKGDKMHSKKTLAQTLKYKELVLLSLLAFTISYSFVLYYLKVWDYSLTAFYAWGILFYILYIFILTKKEVLKMIPYLMYYLHNALLFLLVLNL